MTDFQPPPPKAEAPPLDSLPGPSATLTRLPALQSLAYADVQLLAARLKLLQVSSGSIVVHEGAHDRSAFFILSGTARVESQGEELGSLGPGDHFGELGLLAGRARTTTLVAATALTLARLDRPAFDDLATNHPRLALELTQRLLASVRKRLAEGVESHAVFLRERSRPRSAVVQVRLNGQQKEVRLGTTLGELLPNTLDGQPVVAALVDRKPAHLTTHVSSTCHVEALTTADLDGQRYYRNSQALLLLEAAHRLAPTAQVALSHSVGMGQLVTVTGVDDLPRFASELEARMLELVAADLPLLEEWWTVAEAREHFVRAGWEGAASLLATWRDAAVPLVSYGDVYALSTGPLVASTSRIGGFHVLADRGGLLLMYGQIAAPRSIVPPPAASGGRVDSMRALVHEAIAASHQTALMTAEHSRWLETLGITSVGAFNAACVAGQVTQLIHVSEGFQEKSIGKIADQIVARDPPARIVCIAGPSSAGKTTFIKRLQLQLQVNGIRPVPVSLDDYYVDREVTPRDEHGEYDFEALEALDLPLLDTHLGRLLRGEEVTTARYDFPTGKSHPTGGRSISLGPQDMLMLEGIHGLNPRLLSAGLLGDVFRVFVCPLSQLPFDRLTRVHASDVRLIRRIVRDRHTRGHDAIDSIMRWPSVRAGERRHIFSFQHHADAVFDSSLIYEPAVLKVYAEAYLLEVPHTHRAHATAFRLLQLLDRFVTIYPDNVPRLSILREFIGGSGFTY